MLTCMLGNNKKNILPVNDPRLYHYPIFDTAAPKVYGHYVPYIKFTMPVKVYSSDSPTPVTEIRTRYFQIGNFSTEEQGIGEMLKLQKLGAKWKGFGCFPKDQASYNAFAQHIQNDPYVQIEQEKVRAAIKEQEALREAAEKAKIKAEREALKQELMAQLKEEMQSNKRKGGE